MGKEKKNFYVRLTEQNKNFIGTEAKRAGVSQTAFINILLSDVRKRSSKSARAAS